METRADDLAKDASHKKELKKEVKKVNKLLAAKII
jgi:hypothetical protein